MVSDSIYLVIWRFLFLLLLVTWVRLAGVLPIQGPGPLVSARPAVASFGHPGQPGKPGHAQVSLAGLGLGQAACQAGLGLGRSGPGPGH